MQNVVVNYARYTTGGGRHSCAKDENLEPVVSETGFAFRSKVSDLPRRGRLPTRIPTDALDNKPACDCKSEDLQPNPLTNFLRLYGANCNLELSAKSPAGLIHADYRGFDRTIHWQRIRDSNPCTGLERAVS